MRAWATITLLLLASCGGQTTDRLGDDEGPSTGAGASGSGGKSSVGGAPGAGGETPGAGGVAAPCDPEAASDYFFAIGLSLEPKKPIIAIVSAVTFDTGDGFESLWKIAPLLWSDRKTLAGSTIGLPDIVHDSSGAFAADPWPLDFEGEANPFAHAPITLDFAAFEGTFCPGQAFACGTVGGLVKKPIELSVDGSTWTLTKISGQDFPEPPPVDCQLTPALPVGTWQ